MGGVRRMLLAALAICANWSAAAQESWQGKTISIIIGSAPGGSYDAYARLVARHLGRFLPGNPSVVARNLPGAASVASGHFVVEGAKDGTLLGAPLNTLPLQQLLEPEKISFDVGRFQWIGSVASPTNLLATWHTSGVRTFADARRREVIIGASSSGTTMEMYPLMANDLFGTKFKVVTGYLGGTEINLAMERGEVGGRGANAYQSYAFQKPDWLREGKLNFIFQMALERDPLMKDTPTLLEFARNDEERRVVSMMAVTELIGRSFFVSGGVAPERVAALRRALADVVRDSQFVEDARRVKLDIDFVPGERLQALVGELMRTPSGVVARFKQAVKSRP